MQAGHYKVLQAVLSQTRDTICRIYGITKEEAFIRAEQFIRRNSEQWRMPKPNINYSDPFCRLAYLYMNVAIHAALVERAVSFFPQISKMIREKTVSSQEIRICALGGGPGSELLGVVKLIEGLQIRPQTAYLDFLLVDRVKEWDESWHALKNGVDEQLSDSYGSNRNQWPVITSGSLVVTCAIFVKTVYHESVFTNSAQRGA